ncbi:MAG: glucoamylase [Thermoplasmatales archaeon B_DKE]|nr:MAG: glucoamylase [Thermoplasmatales archaeon B_DKE]
MVRFLPLGNGRLLVNFDKNMNLIDFYYSESQGENHGGHPFKFGVSVNNTFKWINNAEISGADYVDHTMIGKWEFELNGVKFKTENFVDIYDDIYVRKITAFNNTNEPVDLKYYFHQNFYIFGNDIGDTAVYMPDVNGILHYKGARYFFASVRDINNAGMDQFAIGVKEFMGMEGSWKDAEDINLSGNPVAMGSVDSILRHTAKLPPGGTSVIYYYIACGTSLEGIMKSCRDVNFATLARFETRTSNYWRLWGGKQKIALDDRLASLYIRSLLIVRSHMGENGGIVASSDSETIKTNKDGYYYVWPRDAAISAYSLIRANHSGPARKFLNFSRTMISPEGYYYHKYTMAGNLASSWLPRIMGGNSVLPIQEDETALIIWAIWKHYIKNNDIEYLSQLYEPVIKKSADFILSFLETDGLPKPSFDLWEERFGIHTFTIATSYSALKAAARCAKTLGDEDVAMNYERVADRMKTVFEEKFFSDEKGIYARSIIDGKPDYTPDSSIMSLFLFNMKDAGDPRIVSSMSVIMKRLWVNGIGGLARYENDTYQRVRKDSSIPGNPWIITTLWASEFFLLSGDLESALKMINWVTDHKQDSGMLPEQVNPYDGTALSASPLIWSHAQFIITMLDYEMALSNGNSKFHNL